MEQLTRNEQVGDSSPGADCESAVPVLVCHDEVDVECDEDRDEETKRWLEKAIITGMESAMNGADEIDMPVEVDARIASSWGEGG